MIIHLFLHSLVCFLEFLLSPPPHSNLALLFFITIGNLIFPILKGGIKLNFSAHIHSLSRLLPSGFHIVPAPYWIFVTWIWWKAVTLIFTWHFPLDWLVSWTSHFSFWFTFLFCWNISLSHFFRKGIWDINSWVLPWLRIFLFYSQI